MSDLPPDASCSWFERDRRGGTEPLAALVSVAAICVAISVYAGFASITLSASTDSSPDRATLDSVWTATSDDGIVDTRERTFEDLLGPAELPRGYRVAVTLTVVGEDGHLSTVDRATFGENATPADLEPPPGADTDDRPVAVRLDEGDIRPGRLRVVVWDE